MERLQYNNKLHLTYKREFITVNITMIKYLFIRFIIGRNNRKKLEKIAILT